MSLTGNWKGFYEYGYGYGLKQFGQRVAINLQVTDEDGAISGTCEEEKSDIAVDLVSTVQGFYEDRILSFVKTYPKRPNLSEENEIIITDGTLEVEHIGQISEDNNTLFGRWSIYDQFTDEDGKTYEYATDGIWLLERTK